MLSCKVISHHLIDLHAAQSILPEGKCKPCKLCWQVVNTRGQCSSLSSRRPCSTVVLVFLLQPNAALSLHYTSSGFWCHQTLRGSDDHTAAWRSRSSRQMTRFQLKKIKQDTWCFAEVMGFADWWKVGIPHWAELAPVQSQRDSDDSNADPNRSKGIWAGTRWTISLALSALPFTCLHVSSISFVPLLCTNGHDRVRVIVFSVCFCAEGWAGVCEWAGCLSVSYLKPGPGSVKTHQTYTQICHCGQADRAVPLNWMEGWRRWRGTGGGKPGQVRWGGGSWSADTPAVPHTHTHTESYSRHRTALEP